MNSGDAENGMTTVSYVLATGLSLIVITWCTMFIVMSYARSSVRSASIQGSRAGVAAYTLSKNRDFALKECEKTFKENLEIALPPSIRESIASNCIIQEDTIVVKTSGSLRSVTTMMPTLSIEESTRRNLETLP